MTESNDERAAVFVAIDAAIADQNSWPGTLEQLAQYLKASSAALIYEDRSAAAFELRHSSRAQISWLIDCLHNDRKLSARAHVIRNAAVGHIFSAADFLPPTRFYQSVIFQRWLEPHDLIDVIGVILHRSDCGSCIFVAFRSTEAGPVDQEARMRLEALLPKLTEAASLRDPAATEAPAESQLVRLFEQLAEPLVIIDGRMRITRCNDSARKMLKEHPALTASDGALCVADPIARTALSEALRGENAARSCAILLRRGEEKCCIMHLLRLSHEESAILVRSLSRRADIRDDVTADLYGLTARERSVLLAIADVGGVPAAARALRLTESTVKSYLKSIFQKTGAQRQADLVKLAMALESPFSVPRLPAS